MAAECSSSAARISWLDSSVDDNSALAGLGGAAGEIGFGKGGGVVGTAGRSGSGVGGGIFDQGNLTLTCATVNSNKADNGGGIDIHGTLTLTSSQVDDNVATDDGGGINITGVIFVNQSSPVRQPGELGRCASIARGPSRHRRECFQATRRRSQAAASTPAARERSSGTEFLGNSASIGGGIYSSTNSILTSPERLSNATRPVLGGAHLQPGAACRSVRPTFTATSSRVGPTKAVPILNNKGTAAITGSTSSRTTRPATAAPSIASRAR